MDYDNLITLVTGVMPLIGGIVALVSWQNAQFTRLAARIESVQHKQALKDAQIEGKLDGFELRINGNRELIQHRTERFQKADQELFERLSEDIRNLRDEQKQVRGYLEGQGFVVREREQK